MRRCPPLLALLLLASGSASACSLAGMPLGPGAFTVWSLEGEALAVVPVQGRMLGASCELSNRHALQGDVFAWIEMREQRSGEAKDLHVLDLSTGEKVARKGLTTAQLDAMSLWGDRFLWWAWEPAGVAGRTGEFAWVDWRTGERGTLPFPDLSFVSVAMHGPLVAAVSRNDTMDALWVFDASTGEWHERGLPAKALAGERHLWAWGLTDREVWVEAGARAVAYDFREKEVRPAGGETRHRLVDGGWAYETFPTFRRVNLTDGRVEELPRPDGVIVSVQDGRVVTGTFSAPELATPLQKAARSPLSWGAGAAAAAGLAFVAIRRRARE